MNSLSEFEQRRSQTIMSALWAAYGDALGFPTELASPAMVRRRVKSSEVTTTTSWKRVVGGRFGIEVSLPEGAYSDDTQLRLATCRAIRGDGTFDVESFAKVELPVWLSYCLGAGRGSKAAATALSTRKVNWFSNFFADESVDYLRGGGNGAAMRVQPHVWAAISLENPFFYLPDVIRNAVCTHGHMRGVAGAVVHAYSLAEVMRTGAIPSLESWRSYGDIIKSIAGIIREDSELATFWVPVWEERSGKRISDELNKVADEWCSAVEETGSLLSAEKTSEDSYKGVVGSLLGLTAAERGSGLKSALFSLVAAFLFKDDVGADACLKMVANVLYSDTDTIATMTGALLGARLDQPPPKGEIQDASYIMMEAGRMFDVSRGHPTINISYPDLLYWQPPKSSLDVVVEVNNRSAVMGLGFVSPLGKPLVTKQASGLWQWYELGFGQTILCKRREKLRTHGADVVPGDETVQSQIKREGAAAALKLDRSVKIVSDLFSDDKDPPKPEILSLDAITDKVIESKFDPKTIGEEMLKLMDLSNGIELSIAFSSIIAKARRSRRGKI